MQWFKFGFDFIDRYKVQIDKLLNEKLIVINGDRLLATYDGSMVLHRIIEEFM